MRAGVAWRGCAKRVCCASAYTAIARVSPDKPPHFFCALLFVFCFLCYYLFMVDEILGTYVAAHPDKQKIITDAVAQIKRSNQKIKKATAEGNLAIAAYESSNIDFYNSLIDMAINAPTKLQ